MPLKLVRPKGTPNWYIRGTVKGCSIYESTGLSDKRQAEITRARREAELIDQALFGKQAVTTFAQAALTYIEAGGETKFLGRIIAFFGPDRLVSSIDMGAVNACARSLYPTAAPATINRQVIVPISAVMNMHFAAQNKRAPRFARRREPKGRFRWLTPEEAERLIAAASALTLPRHAEPERFTLQKIAFLLGSGCRTGEAFAATVEDWNPVTRQWWIPATATGAGKTEGAARFVDLPERAVTLIDELPTEGRAFRTAYGKDIVLREGGGGQMGASFKTAREAAGLGPDVTPHTLRHTWATWYYAQTRDFGGLMDRGGWLKADTANRYRKIAPADLAHRLLAHGWDFRGKSVDLPEVQPAKRRIRSVK
ncbi:tyrosine-type recombinase/integrase [Rhodobacterales bacterium HKCCE4037]|nr:tyrosine-type recombinase/integrase [Rhodobacterales bacterium HKCCE4037]